MKNKQKILEAAEKSTGCRKKNVSQGTYPKLEEALIVWVKSTVASKVPVSGGLLKQKAKTMALQMNIERFKVSDGWPRKFKKRFDFTFKKTYSESAAVDFSAVVNYRSEKLQYLLQEYSSDDKLCLLDLGVGVVIILRNLMNHFIFGQLRMQLEVLISVSEALNGCPAAVV
ncbi:hypothetical protein HPB51_025666 [Rhipicephalus microplus]|uniref:HTH CENPB-type domain-containing protein n=1 Tax=Rhipicephalus microplus TaxID=6941 RepID=A0A9J6EJV5_RHIMP|nr:hypothetical protein HPB51_025666 [Rhipicephalus microplus]